MQSRKPKQIDVLVDSDNFNVLELESITENNAANTTYESLVSSESDLRDDLPKLKISGSV